MRKLFYVLPLFLALVLGNTFAQTLYVAPTGAAGNPGTLASPTTLQSAITRLSAGGTIFMRGGTYSFSATIIIARGNDGTSGNTKKIYAYESEIPVLNFSAMAESTSNRGIVLDALFWHFRGLIIQGAGDNGLLLAGNNNTIERCIFRNNRDTGLQLSRFNTSFTSISQWPSNNLILNCEAYDNRDASNENADGFAAKLTSGNGNIFRGCVAHHNIDDGWDLFTKSDTGPIGAVTLENCIAHSNGILTTGGTSGNGDKNGFKLGGEDISVNHIVRRCIAFNNGKHGITYNRNLGTIEVTNNTSYNNAERNFNFDGGTSVFKNNLSFQSGSTDRIIGNSSAPNAFAGLASGFTITSADFTTLIPGTNANPTSNGFLNLASNSDAVDGGVATTGITFSGARPDLGAIESGGSATTFALTTTSSPANGGSVTRSPNAASYTSGTVVTLTAVPNSGFTFTGWSGAASSSSTTITVTMDGNKTVTANFTQSSSTFTLAVNSTPSNGGSVTRNPNAASYAAGTVVTLTAVPTSGFTFTGWSGAASGSSATTTVTMDANKTVTANFTQSSSTFTLSINSNPSNGGSVTRSPNATNYAAGTVVTLTAVPASGFVFSSWSGAATGTAATTSVIMNANKTVTANFTATTGTSTLRIEDASTITAGYCGAGGSRQSSYSGADNGFYINISNSTGKGIDWKVSVPSAGTYSLRWRYANAGSSSTTTARVLINGTTAVANASFPKTTSWTNWVTTTTSVSLSSGVNAIRLETITGNEFANIDWIEIIGNSPSAASCSASIGARMRTTDANEVEISQEEAETLAIYPNIAREVVTVEQSTIGKLSIISVLNTSGRVMLSVSAEQSKTEVNVSSLPSGVYLLKVTTDGKTTIKRLMVE